MDNIKNYNPAEAETLDSREVAEMVEKQHRHLLRDINGYIEEMEKTGEPNFGLSSKLPKINPSDFFIPSTYTSEQGKELPCFLVTKKGCEFIANKLTGEKGTKFTAMYVTRFNIMEEREKAAIGGKTAKNGKTPEELGRRRQTGHGDAAQRQEPGGEFPSKSSTTGRAPSQSIRQGSQRFLFRGWDSPSPHGIPGHEADLRQERYCRKAGRLLQGIRRQGAPCPGHWCDYLHAGYLGGRGANGFPTATTGTTA